MIAALVVRTAREDRFLRAEFPGCTDVDNVLRNLSRYNREIAGFIDDGSKYVFCSMILRHDSPSGPDHSGFTLVWDGGSSMVRAVFDATTKSLVHIECNGR